MLMLFWLQHRAFVKEIKDALTNLQAYIKKHHTTGIVWNPKVGE